MMKIFLVLNKEIIGEMNCGPTTGMPMKDDLVYFNRVSYQVVNRYFDLDEAGSVKRVHIRLVKI